MEAAQIRRLERCASAVHEGRQRSGARVEPVELRPRLTVGLRRDAGRWVVARPPDA